MRYGILSFRKTATDAVARAAHAEALLTVAVLGCSLDLILGDSPIFEGKHEQAVRIEEWVVFSLLNDFSERIPWSTEETLNRVRKYQKLHSTVLKELPHTKRNPFGDFVGVFLLDLFADDIKELCPLGRDHLDGLVHITLAGIFSITFAESVRYWKTAYEKFDIV